MDAVRFASIFTEWGLCRTQVLVIRDFTTTCTCKHALLCRVHVVHVYTYTLGGYTHHLRTCRYATIHVNRPSSISLAAAIAVNHRQGVNDPLNWAETFTVFFLFNYITKYQCCYLPVKKCLTLQSCKYISIHEHSFRTGIMARAVTLEKVNGGNTNLST